MIGATPRNHLLTLGLGGSARMDPVAVTGAPGSPSRFPEVLFAAHFDLDLLEATPGIEPGIAVLQVPRIRPGVSAKVRPEIKNGTRRPLTCTCGRRGPPGLGSKLGSGWAGRPAPEVPNTDA